MKENVPGTIDYHDFNTYLVLLDLFRNSVGEIFCMFFIICLLKNCEFSNRTVSTLSRNILLKSADEGRQSQTNEK